MRSRIFSSLLLVAAALLASAPAEAQVNQFQNAGTAVTKRHAANCTGSVYCVDDSSNKVTKIDVGSAGSGGVTVSALATPGAPTVTNVGTTGAVTATYYIVAVDRSGNKTLVSSSGQTTTGNASLTSSNYNHLVWSAVTGAACYDVLKADTAHYLTLCTTALTYNDQGGASTSYTAPTRNSTADIKVDGVIAMKIGTAISSATTITPLQRMFHVTGTAEIDNITAPALFTSGVGGCLYIIPDGAFTTATGGNIGKASTAVVSKVLVECYDPGAGLWFPNY